MPTLEGYLISSPETDTFYIVSHFVWVFFLVYYIFHFRMHYIFLQRVSYLFRTLSTKYHCLS